ncbi:SsrA-binding protein SmpB [Fructilactobacillus vespulae]|uniref:SsrA-binding protein SmpB n=1 Tax=Fructilactobacillus vespulae TaxID=1249630 RepID=UPI0039B4E0ED
MVKKKSKPNDNNVMATNRKARHDYFIEETYEAGIALTGTEIKSIRERRLNLKDGFVSIRNGEALLQNVHINEYTEGNQFNHDPLRSRKLLLHKREIKKLGDAVATKGVTVVPLKVYLKHNFAKVLIGIAKGKREYDKRHDIKAREQKRQIDRVMKHY